MVQKEEVLVTLKTNLESKGVESGAKRSDKALKKMAKSFDRAADDVGDLEDAFDELSGEAKKSASRVAKAADNIDKSMDKASKGKGFDRLLGSFAKIGLAGFAIKAGIGAATNIIGGFASKIEEAAVEIDTFNGLMDGIASSTEASRMEIEAFSEVAQGLAFASGEDASKIASLISLFTNLGASQQDAARAVRASVNIANTQGRDLERVAKAILDTYKGSREQAIELGIDVKGLTREELLRGKALDKIEMSMGTQLQFTTETTEATLQTRKANQELNIALQEVYRSSEPIRELWEQYKLDVARIGISLAKWATKILPDLRVAFRGFFTGLFGTIEKFILTAEIGLLRVKQIATEIGTLGIADTSDISGRIAGLQARRSAVSETIKNRFDSDSSQSSLFEDLSKAIDKNTASLDDTRTSVYGSEDILARHRAAQAADRAKDRDERKKDMSADLAARQKLIDDQIRLENQRIAEERRFRDSIGVSSILGGARGAVSATAAGAELQGLLDQITGSLSGLSIDDAISRSRGSGSDDLEASRFRHSLLTELSGVIESNDRAEAQRSKDAKRAQDIAERRAEAEEKREAENKARQEKFNNVVSQISEALNMISRGASVTIGEGEIDSLRQAGNDFEADQQAFNNQQIAIEASAEVATKVGEAALEAINPALSQLAGPLIDLFLLSPDKVNTFFANLADGFLIIIDTMAANVAPILEAMAKQAPRFISAIAGAAPRIIGALIPHIPRIAFVFTTELLKALGRGLINMVNALISGVESAINSIPFVHVSLDRLRGGDQAPIKLAPPVSAPSPVRGEGFTDSDFGPVEPPLRARANDNRYINDRIAIERAQRRDNILTAAEAFNPYHDSGVARQRQPIALQIQIGNQRLRDILTDLDESGYNRVVTA